MTLEVIRALTGNNSIYTKFKCWLCGRYAKLLSVSPYPDEPGYTFTWQCKKCGRRSEGT